MPDLMTPFFKMIFSGIKSISGGSNFKSITEIAPNHIGVYIMKWKGKVMYVGRAIENRPGQSTSGLRKRLQEHYRGAGNCKSELYQHRDEINVTIRLCNTVDDAKKLEAQIIKEYDTVNNGWNLRYED